MTRTNLTCKTQIAMNEGKYPDFTSSNLKRDISSLTRYFIVKHLNFWKKIFVIMNNSGSHRKRTRFYDHIAQFIPQYATIKTSAMTTRQIPGFKRGSLVSMTHKVIEEEPIDDFALSDSENIPFTKNQMKTKTQPIMVQPLPMNRKNLNRVLNISFKFKGEEFTETDDESLNSAIPQSGAVPIATSFDRMSSAMSQTNSALNSARETSSACESATVSPMNSPHLEEMPKPIFEMDKSEMPYIPPLAVDLAQFLQTIPDSAPASLSPYTFCEEVVSLNGPDFEQFLEEDTLCLKSVLFGNRFNEDTIYDFYISLTEEQYYSAFGILFRQYAKLAKIANLLRDFWTSQTISELANKIEKECEALFRCRTALVWINIPSANTLVNHSRLMKYPIGVGLVGTAAAEKRQVVAPNPTRSPIYSEEYDLPFCEESEIILVEPITNPKTGELYAVIMMIDKVHQSGATYMYWPQSELTLLRFFSQGLYRVFNKFDEETKATSKLYGIVAKNLIHQLNFFRLLSTISHTITQYVKCEAVSLYFREGKTVFWFESEGNKVNRKSTTVTKVGIAGYVFEHNVYVHCASACDHPAFSSTYDGKYKSRAVLAVPMVVEKDVFAVCVARAKKQLPCFTTPDVQNMSFIAASSAPALRMSMSYRQKLNELRVALRAQDRLAALLQTAESLSRETNIDTLVARILMNSCNLIGADRASLFVLDESRTHLISKVAHGTTKPLLLPISNGIAGHVATTGETINIPDVYEDPRFNSSVDKATGYRTKSLMTIPVKDQNGSIISVAQLMNKLSEEPFTDADVELMKAMSVFTGIALANSTTIEGSLTSTQRVNSLLETVVLLMRGESLSSVIHHIMSVSRDLVQADRCGLFMIENDKATMKSTVLAGENNQIQIKNGKGVVGYVAQHSEIVNIPDAYKDKRFHSAVDQETGYRTRSILAAPVVNSANEVIGVVEMINKDQIINGGAFTKEDEKLISAFASFVGLAFDQKHKYSHTSGQTVAILLSNMMTADESNSCDPPVLIMLPPDKMEIFKSNRFDVSTLTELDTIRFIASIFHDLGISKQFKINNAKLIRFLLNVHDFHKKGQYHSWKRAIECVQFVYYLLATTELNVMIPPLEILAVVVAAICHDVDHYDFDDESRSEIALSVLYRNRPIMEMHHCEQTINIISQAEQNIFENVEPEQQAILWQTIISLILGTDMAKHFELVNKYSALVYPQNMLNLQIPAHKLLLEQMIIKMGDASAACRLFQINDRWSRTAYKSSLPEEERKAIGQNRFKDDVFLLIAEQQVGFINIISRPILRGLVEVAKSAKPALDQMEGNLNEWKLRIANLKKRIGSTVTSQVPTAPTSTKVSGRKK